MKTKKNISKQKKKKSITESHNNTGIRKTKKVKKIKKLQKNTAVLETLKEELNEQDGAKKQVPNRQQIWNTYLKTFSQTEKLNKKQKQIMEFCTNKSLTPPKRKRKFLNFIRNCFVNQADISDEQINELFDLLLKKYDDFKSGTYSATNSNDTNADVEAKPKLSVNKKKKLKRAAAKASPQDANTSDGGVEEKVEKIKHKKKKRAKITSTEMEVDDNNSD